MTATVGDTLQRAIRAMMGLSGSPRLDAQLILGHVLDKPREYLIAHPEHVLTDVEQHTFDKLLTLRTKGMPVAYILGSRPFFDRTFILTPHVLIPRPETEHIVEATLEWAKGRGPLRIIDVGTGSGAIAVTVAAHLPDAQVIAADVSLAALMVARENGADLTNIQYVQADLLLPFRGPLDVVCANLPYIATGDINMLEVAKFEPHVALDGGFDGMNLIRRMLEQAPGRLATPGLILIEIATDQKDAVIALSQAAFPQATVSIIKDYAGLDRVVRVEV
ncbi:MAG: peptide chain release factor N(5)-glutamine methyltransferase [Anaerolineae bacterium]|nr:peptide chain release factor N(5)-glutamine methyltransferase [Anaerolineae bacterium]